MIYIGSLKVDFEAYADPDNESFAEELMDHAKMLPKGSDARMILVLAATALNIAVTKAHVYKEKGPEENIPPH